MRAKSFFYVCAGLFLLALGYHLGAGNAGAQVGGQEVAMLSGEVQDGETIPLPRYADGVEALESECRWIVSPKVLDTGGHPATFQRCEAPDLVLRAYWCHSNCGPAGDCALDPECNELHAGTASYLIVAVRHSAPTPAQRESMGKLKARYR